MASKNWMKNRIQPDTEDGYGTAEYNKEKTESKNSENDLFHDLILNSGYGSIPGPDEEIQDTKKQEEGPKKQEFVYFDTGSYEEAIASDEEEYREEKAERKRKRVTALASVVLITLCVYMICLIYGVFCTEYAYDADGRTAPVVLTPSELKEKKAFDTVTVSFEKIMILYKKILLLDYRFDAGVEDTMTLAPEYSELLEDDDSDLAVSINGLTVTSKYETVRSLMYDIAYTKMAAYLSDMSKAITNNDTELYQEALTAREELYNSYVTTLTNIEEIGSSIKGCDLSAFEKFNPDTYAEEYINGTY